MEVRELQYPYYSTTATSRITWRAVFAGAFVAAAVTTILGLWGIGVGAIKVPTVGMAATFGAKAAIWIVLTMAISFGCGGWVASRLAGLGSVGDSVLHGLTSWAVALVGMFVLYPMAFAPNGLLFTGTAVRTLGWMGFICGIVSAFTACAGAISGTRLLHPMPVDEYQRLRRHGGGVAPGSERVTTTSRY